MVDESVFRCAVHEACLRLGLPDALVEVRDGVDGLASASSGRILVDRKFLAADAEAQRWLACHETAHLAAGRRPAPITIAVFVAVTVFLVAGFVRVVGRPSTLADGSASDSMGVVLWMSLGALLVAIGDVRRKESAADAVAARLTGMPVPESLIAAGSDKFEWLPRWLRTHPTWAQRRAATEAILGRAPDGG